MPVGPGIYVFGRRYGKSFEALYVGKANSIRARIHSQFKNLPLMMRLKNSKSGKKIVLAGRYIGSPGQKAGNCITIAERALIRHFLAEGHDLVNIQGTLLRRHEIKSAGSAQFVPAMMFLDKTRRE